MARKKIKKDEETMVEETPEIDPFKADMMEEEVVEGVDPDTEVIAKPKPGSEARFEAPPEPVLPPPPKPIEERTPKALLDLFQSDNETEMRRWKRMLTKVMEPSSNTIEATMKCILFMMVKMYEDSDEKRKK